MHVSGKWLICEDGVIRPSVVGMVRAADSSMLNVPFLLDAGADRTVFSARFLQWLEGLPINQEEQIQLTGVGGPVESITVNTAIGLIRNDGHVVMVRGSFAVFTESESAELSVLGRDVTNNFSVIYDYPNRAVALLAAPHYYEIRKA